MKKKSGKSPSESSKRQREGNKKQSKSGPILVPKHQGLWICAAAAGLILFVVAAFFIARGPDHDGRTVARVNGRELTSLDVRNELWGAQTNLRSEYGAWDIEYDDEFRDGETFAQAVRREAAKLAAVNLLLAEYAEELGVDAQDEHSMRWNLVEAVMANPAEFARFEPYMPPEEEDATTRANNILARALAGEDFDMLVATYGEDPGMEWNPDGYTFGPGAMVEEFEQGTRDLEIGEISGLVRSTFGYHIIKRVEPNPDEMHDEHDDWLGAKHILISDETVPLDVQLWEVMQEVFLGRAAEADIEILRAIDDISIETEW